MALPSRYGVDKSLNSMEGLSAYENGGKGSGNFGHSGRPGEVGGSGDGKGVKSNIDELKKNYEKAEEELDRLSDKLADAEDELEMAKEDDNISYASDMRKRIDELSHQIDIARGHRDEAYDKLSQAKSSQKESGSVSLKGKSLYEKIHLIEPGDEVHIQPKDNLPNFDKKIKVDYIQDGTIHYGSSETSDGYTYPAWAIKDITKIVRKKKNEVELNGGKGSGNFGHAGRPGEVGGSGKGFGGSNTKDIDDEIEKTKKEIEGLGEFLGSIPPSGVLSSEMENIEKASKELEKARKKLEKLEKEKKGSGGKQSGESFRGYDDLSKPMPKTAAEDEKLLTGKKYEFGIEEFHRDVVSGRKKDLDKAGMRAFWRADALHQMSRGFLSKKLAVSIARDRMKELAKDPDNTKYSVKWDDKNAEFKIKKKNSIYAEAFRRLDEIEKMLNGGKGSGNFGHAGRPGQVGGSGDGKGVIDEKATRELRERLERLGESFRQSPGMKVLIEKDRTGEVKDEIIEKTGLEKDLYEKKQAQVERIKEKIGKDIDITADDLSDDPWRDLRYITVTDKDGEEYSYDAISEQVHKRSSGEEMLAPSVKKALADKDELWKKASWEIKGQEVKKKLKEYGINTDGLSVSRKSGGYSDAWYISGSGKKTDLKSAERILKDKLESYERDVSGEILMGGNTFVFVTDTDRNSLKKKETSEYNGEMMMGMPSRYGVDKKINSMEGMSAYENGGPGSGNFGHAGRPGEVGGSSKDGGGMNPNTKIAKDLAKQKEYIEKAKQVTKDIEDRIGQKMKEGETYTAFDEAKFSRFKFFHGEDGTEYTYDKIADTITKTNPKTGDQEPVEKSGLVSNEGSNLGVTRKDFDTAKQVAKERAGKMSVYEDMNDGLYHAKDNFYDRKFDTKKGATAFKSGYDDGDKASSFDQLDYTKRQTKSGNSRYDVSYKGTDKSYGKSFNNPIEAQYYTEGYNSKIRAIESEVPSEAWKKIKK